MVLIFLFTFFQYYSVVSRDSKFDNFANSLFLFIIIRSGLAEIRWSVCMSKSHGSLCVPFSRTDAGLFIYHLLVWWNFYFLNNSQWITLLTQSCVLLYSLCANLLHSLIMWLIVSSLSPHYYYYLLIRVFSHQCKLMVFHWSLSDSKSPQVSRTLLSILAVFNNAVVWMVSTRPLTSKSSRPFNNLLVTVPKAPITIGIIVTFMFNSFFSSLARSRYLSLFSHSFSFILWSAGTAKSKILQIFFFFSCWLLLGLVYWPRFGDPCVCQNPIGVYMCYFLGQVLGCAYTICSYVQI